jgi:hypothetical protein
MFRMLYVLFKACVGAVPFLRKFHWGGAKQEKKAEGKI